MEITLALRQRDHCPGSGRSMPCPDVSAAARRAVPRRFRWGAACRAPTSPLRQRDHCPGSGRSMPCPDVSTAARLAVPRRLRCGSAIIARGWGVACRAPTFPLGRSMPRPDVSTAARQRVLCVRRNAYIYVLWRSSPDRKSAGRSSFPLVLRRQKGHMQMGCRCYCNEHRRRVC